jgi:hypothetical protein
MKREADLPPSLFRYYPANLQTLENVKRQCLYFGSVVDFNDPFESHILPPAAQGDEEILRELRAHYDSAPDVPEAMRSQIQAMNPATFGRLIAKSAVEMLLAEKETFKTTRGVTCFSQRNENLLMWSHYASGGAGLCLEFDTQTRYSATL